MELVAHLQTSDSDRELQGHILFEKLSLHEPEPPNPVREFQIKRFMDEWHVQNPDQSTWGKRLHDEIQRRYPPKPKVKVSIWVDWHDYAPLRDGLPVMHYRFQIARPGKTGTEDARAKDLVEAKRIICKAFGW